VHRVMRGEPDSTAVPTSFDPLTENGAEKAKHGCPLDHCPYECGKYKNRNGPAHHGLLSRRRSETATTAYCR
jgi:hypothetical protein